MFFDNNSKFLWSFSKSFLIYLSLLKMAIITFFHFKNNRNVKESSNRANSKGNDKNKDKR